MHFFAAGVPRRPLQPSWKLDGEGRGLALSNDSTVYLAPGAIVLGNAGIGDRVLVGSNATILPAITVGHHSTVGAGSVVTGHLSDGARAFGNPARNR